MRDSIFAVLAVLTISAYPMALTMSVEDVEITVKDKERTSGENQRYLIFADGEVFENADSLLFVKFNSSDVQGKLERGKTYRVKVYGWRVPFLSMYRNIVTVYR